MTNETKHTPTPWAWIEGDPDIFTHWNNKEVVLATVKHPVWHEDRLCGSMEAAANAAHIVKCVNMHDELVEALSELMKVYSEPDEEICCNGYHCGCQGASVRQQAEYYARETLKKAGAL